MRVHGMSLGAAKACSGHSQESSSLRRQQLLWRQQLTWVIVASALQSTPTMSKKQEANAPGLPREGQPPLLYRRRQQQVTHSQPQVAPQVTWTTTTPILGNRPTLFPIRSRSPTVSRTRRCRREGGHSVPHSGVTGPQRLSVSDLLPLHGPRLTPAPACQLSAQTSGAPTDNVKLPHLPAAAASEFTPRGRARAVGAASDSVKLPPLPAAPAAAASGSSLRGAARAVSPMARGQPERVPPPPWGTLVEGRAQGTPSLESRTEGLWHGSVARQGHCLPPATPARSVLRHTGAQPAWKRLGCSEKEGVIEVQGEHDSSTYRDLFGGPSLYLSEDRSIVFTCTHQQSRAHQEMDAEPQELPSASSATKGCTEETGKCPELLYPAHLAEQSSFSEKSHPWDSSVKDLEEKLEDQELSETQAAGQWDSNVQSMLLALLKENKVEAESSVLDGDSWDKGHGKPFLTSEPEETSSFSASLFSGSPCEERATGWPAEHTAHLEQQWVWPKHLDEVMQEMREELEEDKMDSELFGDISSMGNQESTIMSSCKLRDPSVASLKPAGLSVPRSACRVTEDAMRASQNDSEFVSPELLPELRSDSEDSPSLETLLNNLMEWEIEEASEEWDSGEESPLSIPPRDEELEPAPVAQDSHLSDQGHSEPLPWALPQEAKGFAGCASPADAAEEAEAAGMEAGRAQAASPQEKPCGDEPPAGACPVPAQPLARSVPAGPAGSAAVPQPPAPRPRRSMAKRARRALRRLFSFSCLRGQPEE